MPSSHIFSPTSRTSDIGSASEIVGRFSAPFCWSAAASAKRNAATSARAAATREDYRRFPAGHACRPSRPNTAVQVASRRAVLWLETQRAVISGDTLVDFGQGLEINERWLPPGVTRDEVATGLRPLLDLPVEHVLATHGGPNDRAALERALA